MNYVNENILSLERISISNMLQEIGTEEVRKEILMGLQQENKYISSKFFYNSKGTELYNAITRQAEYYPTRTEKAILERIAPDLMHRHRGYELVELGPGDSAKISILLRAASIQKVDVFRYMPLDISRSALENIADTLVRDFPRVVVEAYALDFMAQFEVLKRERPLLICFLGSTIGNLEYPDALALLSGISRQMKPGDTLLLGMDLLKDREVLHAAYNDAAGVTAQFNLNILNSVNDLLQSDFKASDFDHLAFFNPELGRIEMHLVARRQVLVVSPHMDSPLKIMKNERIHTENSHKYSMESISAMARATDLNVDWIHTDPRSWFALSELSK